MRYIRPPRPEEAPDSFKRWKRKHQGAKYSRFKDSRAKAATKDSLIKRQKCLCCYCESRIGAETSHIEHLEPQYGGMSDRTMDYSNLAASCIKDPKHVDYSDGLGGGTRLDSSAIHCGHARGTNTVVSPYNPDCERMFEYSFGGEIAVAKSLKSTNKVALARDSIDFLRLNVSQLVSLRAAAMYEVVKLLEQGARAEDLFSEIGGRLPPFYSAALSAAKRWVDAHSKNSGAKQSG